MGCIVVEAEGRIAGILDIVPQEWNHTVWLWNISWMKSIRGQGVGRELFSAG
jgi:N-acetylglutamate synthase-like GNAT family acetyltransferase